MKKLQLIIVLLFCAKAGICQQLLLSGTVKGTAKHDPIEINVPYDGNYWKKNSTYLKPDATGNFHISFPFGTEKFIILVYKEKQHYLLLSPGRPLHVTINTRSPYLFSFSGKGSTENELLQQLKLESPENLSFIKDIKLNGYKSYANWSIDSVIRIKLPTIKYSLDSTQQLVHKAMLPVLVKKTIAAEVKYYYACALAEDLGSWLNTRKNRIDFNTRFIDTVWSDFALPSKDELAINMSANSYLDTYLRYKTWKAVFIYSQDKNKDHADSVFKKYTGIDFKELSNDPDRTNEIYLFSTRLRAVAPQYAWEKNLANLLFSFCMQGQLQSADKLLHFIRANCADKQYIAASEKMFAPLKKLREQYAGNLDIKIRPGYRNISSVKSLLAPYKGKVVFVDLWGTWCPHCIEDMAYEPDLKTKFKGKDIVFLYIADDEDKNDEVWRDFIFINNLTGEHVRRTTDQMAALWNELGIKDSDQAYPHYFIFDRSGNIANNNAKRPGDGNALYNQLELALNNK
jgi:thiol-disulfide isomerase/thioredoxin